jgi:aspartyl-tRNA(Asn)/glutamyl-tRNA(Gln) amidotransferase subunit A
VAAAFEAALTAWRDGGATIVDIELPHAALAIPVYYLIATAEASSNLARYDGARYGYRTPVTAQDTLRDMYERTRDEGFGAEVKRRIMLGTYVLSAGYYDAYYLKAQQVRAKVRDDYAAAFTAVDLVATPTTPTPAFKLGEKTADPLQMYLADIFTVSANLAGVPAMSLPCGLSAEGLPIGCQLTAAMWDEAALLRAGAALQDATDWHLRTPAAMAPA